MRGALRHRLELIGKTSLAALLIAVADVIGMGGQGASIGTALAAAGVLLWFGQLLAVVALCGLGLRDALQRGLLASWPAHFIDAALVSAASLPFAIMTFSGAGVRRTYLGTVGPWLTFAVVLLASAWLSRAARARPRVAWTPLGCALGALGASVLLYVDRHVYPHGYLHLHVLSIAGALAALTFALHVVVRATAPGLIAIGLSFLLWPWLSAFPASDAERVLLSQAPLAVSRAVKVAQLAVDFDRDGSSPLFGGGDCDDLDPQRHPSMAERAGDAVDSDCDGADDPVRSARSYAAFRGDRQRADAIAARARALPTVVIVVDALRGDLLDDPRWPNLRELARESLSFSQAFATSSSTATSVPAILSGKVHPSAEDPTIAERLAQRGVRSALVTVDVVVRTVRGELPGGRTFKYPLLDGFTPAELIETEGKSSAAWGGGLSAPTSAEITERGLRLLASAAAPRLLWLHYFDLHQWNQLELPDLPPKNDYTRYAAVLQRIDAALAPWLARRDQLNLVLLADHGEALGAHGEAYHTWYLFRELAHVPLLIRVPGVPAGRVATPITLVTLFDTLIDLQGVEREASAVPNSLLALIGVSDPGPGPGFASFDKEQWSFVHDHYRLVHAPSVQLSQLYDVRLDPNEQRDIARAEPALTADLLARLRELSLTSGPTRN